MAQYEEKLLTRLVESYRKSKKDKGTNAIARRTQIEPSKLYKSYNRNDGDIAQIEAVNQAVRTCADKGYITFAMNGFSNEIAKIYLVDERVDDIETYLKRTYGYEPMPAKLAYVAELLRRYEGRSPAADAECRKLRGFLERHQVPKEYGQLEAVLKALVFIETNDTPLYLREASLLLYGDSKALETEFLGSVCNILRDVYGVLCGENEMPDEILTQFQIVKEPQMLCIKGNVTLTLRGKTLDVGALRDGIVFRADELPYLEAVRVGASSWMTVENKTSYMRLRDTHTAYMYLGGYADRFQRDFLKLVYRDNSALTYYHFGDIDAGGFYIYEHLRRITGIPFAMYKMSPDVLQDTRFAACLHELTETDRIRLQALAEQEPFKETATYMLEHNVKLEQEIVSYYEDKTAQKT